MALIATVLDMAAYFTGWLTLTILALLGGLALYGQLREIIRELYLRAPAGQRRLVKVIEHALEASRGPMSRQVIISMARESWPDRTQMPILHEYLDETDEYLQRVWREEQYRRDRAAEVN